MEKALKSFPETRNRNFFSNRDTADIRLPLQNIFRDEFKLISDKYASKISLANAWSVTYKKGDHHLPHNHGSAGYAAILYLSMHKNHPLTIYLQPWNNERDKSVLFKPPAKEGDIVIVPRFIIHHTEPNTISTPKRIVGFDFDLI